MALVTENKFCSIRGSSREDMERADTGMEASSKGSIGVGVVQRVAGQVLAGEALGGVPCLRRGQQWSVSFS